MTEQVQYTKYGFRESISKEEVSSFPKGVFDHDITVVDNQETQEEAVQYLSKCKVLGFDTETRPSFKKGKQNKVALLQLSDGKRTFLIKIDIIGLSDGMKEILASPAIVKAGVAVRDDIKALNKMNPFKANGFVELQQMAKEYGISDMSLLKLSAIVLGFRISKSQRLSNWEAPKLSAAQQQYAATDAWVGYEIYTKLKASKEI